MGLFQKAEAGISGSSAMTMGAVNVVGLSAGYWRDQPVFTDLSFHIDGPGWFRLDGANGSGKSTLFEVLAGYLVPLAGSVSVNGQEVRPGHRVAGLKLQRSSPALVPGVTISDHLHLYGRRYGCSTEYLREISRELGLEERSLFTATGNQALTRGFTTPQLPMNKSPSCKKEIVNRKILPRHENTQPGMLQPGSSNCCNHKTTPLDARVPNPQPRPPRIDVNTRKQPENPIFQQCPQNPQHSRDQG